MTKFSKKILKNLLTTRFIFTLLGLSMIGFSAYYNILYFTRDMATIQDYSGAFVGAALADMLKAAMALALPVLWAGRKYIFLLLALMVFSGTTGLSLYAAHEVKLKQQLEVSARKQKVQQARDRITGRYLKAEAALKGFETVAPVETIEKQLKKAIKQIEKTRVWRSSTQCMNATIEKSVQVCKAVNDLRAALPQAQKKQRAMAEMALATEAVSKLAPLVDVAPSKRAQQLVALVFAIMLEIGSSLLLPMARLDFARILAVHSRKAGKTHHGQKQKIDQPQEANWIEAMCRAAIDAHHAKVVFDDDGLMRAPYSALADVWGVKSVSTVGQRLQRLQKGGWLEKTGQQKNMRYRLLENV